VSVWTSVERRLGFWSALSVAFLGLAYFGTGLVWLVTGGWRSPEPLEPAEPFLAVLELLILLTVLALVLLAAAVHAYALPDRKTHALAALAFMTAFAALSGGVHFVQLAVARHLPTEAVAERAALRLYPWPSIALALDFLAWDLFLGLALLLTAPVFAGGKLSAAVRISTRLSGALCVIGFLGPLLGEMRLQFLAISGYAFVLPVVCALLALLFSRSPKS
jgi:hypothetical protein